MLLHPLDLNRPPCCSLNDGKGGRNTRSTRIGFVPLVLLVFLPFFARWVNGREDFFKERYIIG